MALENQIFFLDLPQYNTEKGKEEKFVKEPHIIALHIKTVFTTYILVLYAEFDSVDNSYQWNSPLLF